MVETGSTRGRYSARVLDDVAAGQVWPRLDAVYPSFATYRQRTTRTIQIVELSPLGRADEAPLTSVG